MTVPWNPLMIIHCRRGLRWVYVRIFMDSSENGMSAYLCPFEEMTWIVHNRKEETDTVRIRLADFSGLHCVKRELKNVWNDANRLILFFRRNQMTCNQCVGNSISLLVQQWLGSSIKILHLIFISIPKVYPLALCDTRSTENESDRPILIAMTCERECRCSNKWFDKVQKNTLLGHMLWCVLSVFEHFARFSDIKMTERKNGIRAACHCDRLKKLPRAERERALLLLLITQCQCVVWFCLFFAFYFFPCRSLLFALVQHRIWQCQLFSVVHFACRLSSTAKRVNRMYEQRINTICRILDAYQMECDRCNDTKCRLPGHSIARLNGFNMYSYLSKFYSQLS